jgi:hypothetical protein
MGYARSQPFPHTDLHRVQLLGMIDAMVNSKQPPPMYALHEVLATLERFHAATAAFNQSEAELAAGSSEAQAPAQQARTMQQQQLLLRPQPAHGVEMRAQQPPYSQGLARPPTRSASRR